jgi:hypothetical protein
MTVLQTLVAHYSKQTRFPDYRSMSDYVSGRRSRLPAALVVALTMDHGRIWRAYYRKVRGFAGTHELILMGAVRGPDGQMDAIDAVVLRRTGTDGKVKLSLLYGMKWLIRATPAVNKLRYRQWQQARQLSDEGFFDDEEDD